MRGLKTRKKKPDDELIRDKPSFIGSDKKAIKERRVIRKKARKIVKKIPWEEMTEIQRIVAERNSIIPDIPESFKRKARSRLNPSSLGKGPEDRWIMPEVNHVHRKRRKSSKQISALTSLGWSTSQMARLSEEEAYSIISKGRGPEEDKKIRLRLKPEEPKKKRERLSLVEGVTHSKRKPDQPDKPDKPKRLRL